MCVAIVCVAPAPAPAKSLVGTTSANAFDASFKFHVHFANGHYWVIYHNGSGIELFSSPDGVSWTSQGVVFSFNPSDRGWGARYFLSEIVAVAHDRTGSTDRYYRNGTLNLDGSVSWNAPELAVGPAATNMNDHNAAIANSKPLYYRANTVNGGELRWGDAFDNPTVPWASSPTAPPLSTTTLGNFVSGALFPVGGADPEDLIILRATTDTVTTPGAHRLVSIKYDRSANSFDASWYNVSTLGGGISEDATTEVLEGGSSGQERFGAVTDSSGNIHAAYVNRNSDIVHYRKDPGFNDNWSRLFVDVDQSPAAIDRVALSAASSGNLFLFYSKSDNAIYWRRFDGASWGAENVLSTSGTSLNGALAPMELASGCATGLAWAEGSNVYFSLLDTGCGSLVVTEGSGTYTVTAPASFELRFNTAAGGSVDQFFDLAEDPARAIDLAGGVASYPAFFHDAIFASSWHSSAGNQGNRLDLLEATPTRVRIRQESYYQDTMSGLILPGLKGIGDWSIYPSGRAALQWRRVATPAVSWTASDLDWVVHWDDAAGPLNNWAPYGQSGALAPSGPGSDDFLLVENNSASARTDFLSILSSDWPHAESTDWSPQGGTDDAGLLAWTDTDGFSMVAGSSETVNFLTYFKPTGFTSNVDVAVTDRRDDYRSPDSLSITVGSSWNDPSENSSSDHFNEAEGAYVLTLDPTLGLRFDIDGGTTPRFRPFFKVRQWRSLSDPVSVTLEGSPLANDLDYQADVKPVARAHFAQDLLWHSTLQDLASLGTAPDVGTAGAVSGTVNFVPGRYGNGAEVVGTSSYFNFPTAGNFDTAKGAIEFWFKPTYASDDGSNHTIGGYNFNGANYWLFEKDNANNLSFTINALAVTSQIAASSAQYSWRAGEWVHLRFEWDDSLPVATQLRIFVNGVEPNPGGGTGADYVAATNVSTNFQIGRRSPQSGSPGMYDEVRVYGGSGSTPQPLAHGGLSASASEYFASGSNNFTLNFAAVDAVQRGEHLYFGSDSKFRGLNVALATPGAGTPDLQWEYWNGATWATLESGLGFTDETSHFTATGTIFWTGDPSSWSPYSINGGPDLYYVRAHLLSGAYTTSPVEAWIKTDILVFQYCNDITTDAQTFDFAVPVPTAVSLAGFRARGSEGGIELEWETASEWKNLGFHLYRSRSEEGPFERITADPIPGLGSSPEGASYRYLDTSVEPGIEYYYELEDIETTGATTRHGPVSATAATAGDVDRTESATIRYGTPEESYFRVRSRGEGQIVLELHTAGFLATAADDGTVSFEISGGTQSVEDGAVAIPVRRSWVVVPGERQAARISVDVEGVVSFSGLRPRPATRHRVIGTSRATVHLGSDDGVRRRPAAMEGLVPSEWARLVTEGYQADVRKALVELAPLRWDAERNELHLARRIVVRLHLQRRKPDARRGASPRRREGVVARLVARERGLYAASFEDVFGKRRGRTTPVESLRLSRQGRDVPFHLEPDTGLFGPGTTLFFFSPGESTNPYGNELVYELETGRGGSVMEDVDAAPAADSSSMFWHLVEREDDRYYQAALVEAPDPWFWDLLFGASSKSYRFLAGHVRESSRPGRLTVHLQGVSDFAADPDHHLRIYVNGVPIAESRFDGKKSVAVEAEIPPGVVRSGDNELTLENVGDTEAAYSMVMLDRFDVLYPRHALAENGRLDGLWLERGTAAISGLRSGFLIDVTSEASPRWLSETEMDRRGTIRFRVEGGERVLAVHPEWVRRPEIRRPAAELLSTGGAEYMILGPRTFLEEAGPLLEHRRRQGLRSRGISVEQIYDEFGYGESSPQAIRDFLTHAYHFWDPRPRYVVLLGDATFDFKDRLGTGVSNQLPPFMIRTSYLWTASDPSYATVHGDDPLPDVAIGRLPAADVNAARLLVEKILTWEDRASKVADRIVLVADNPDRAGNFPGDADALASTVLSGYDVRKVYLSQLGRHESRLAVIDAFDRGAYLVSYLGHGGIHLWADENIFNISDTSLLESQVDQPLLLTMNCLNGYFHFPYFDSLSESLLEAEGKGAIAAFSPSGLSLNGPASRLHQVLMRELLSGRYRRLGDAVLAAQAIYAQTGDREELLLIYHLLGDPALALVR